MCLRIFVSAFFKMVKVWWDDKKTFSSEHLVNSRIECFLVGLYALRQAMTADVR